MYSGEEPIIACVFEKVINAFLFKTYFALCTANYLQKVSQLIRFFFFFQFFQCVHLLVLLIALETENVFYVIVGHRICILFPPFDH